MQRGPREGAFSTLPKRWNLLFILYVHFRLRQFSFVLFSFLFPSLLGFFSIYQFLLGSRSVFTVTEAFLGVLKAWSYDCGDQETYHYSPQSQRFPVTDLYFVEMKIATFVN